MLQSGDTFTVGRTRPSSSFSGVLTLQVDEQQIEAGPGTPWQWLPRRVPHAFANLSDEPVWAVGVIVPRLEWRSSSPSRRNTRIAGGSRRTPRSC